LTVGLLSSPAAVPLLVDIVVAIATTKIPMLLKQGFWATMHEGRTDFRMLLGLVAILLFGSGHYSLDYRRGRAKMTRSLLSEMGVIADEAQS
jgi:uncharacterized membrane protein YphA (DoxX/SURF4 family)